MSDIVSARRLRKSLLKQMEGVSFNINNNLENNINREKYNRYEKNIYSKSKKNNNNIKNKFILKCFFSLLIIFICLLCKLCFNEKVIENKYCKLIINKYQNDYNKEEILDKIENLSNIIYDNIKYIVPETITKKIQEKYVLIIKPYVINFYLKDSIKQILNIINTYETQNVMNKNVNIYSNINSNLIEETESLNGKGGGEPLIAEASLIEESSAVSIMQQDIEQILSKKIDIKSPLSGVITSTYGIRDEIFKGVNSYHTGIDIAAKTGTEIKSATVGKVVKIKKNDKYYGNYVVVETNGVSFKYAHMSEIKVKNNQEVSQNTIVGLVGSTGMSTGPHLHFEIIINSRTVDPQNILKF